MIIGERRDPLLQRLLGPLDALTLLQGASPEALARPGPEGAWSAADHLAHLARMHEVFLERLQRIQTEERPALPRYRAEDDPEFERWRRLPPGELAGWLRALRARVGTALAALDGERLARTGHHPLLGELNVRGWLEFFLVHEGHHLYRAALLAARPADL